MSLEIRAIQRALVNHLGKPLEIDGIAGPETQWAMAVQYLPIERQLAIRRAQRHLGIIETAPNVDSDGVIAQYLAECGIRSPAPYCAAACSCWLALPGVREPGARKLGQLFPATCDPIAGDLLWFPTGSWEAHIELVLGADDLEVMSAGANVSNGFRIVRRPKVGLNFSRTPLPLPALGTPTPGVIRRGVTLYTRPGLTR